MQFEVEQKHRTDDFDQVTSELKRLSARFGSDEKQVDQYFAHPQRDFAQTDEALRIRRVGNTNCITYKGPKVDKVTKTRREIEVSLEPGDTGAEKAAAILLELGFKPVTQVSKVRRSADVEWKGRTIHVALDDVPGVGRFVELELMADEQDIPAAREALASLAEHLKLGASERRSYLELLLQANQRG